MMDLVLKFDLKQFLIAQYLVIHNLFLQAVENFLLLIYMTKLRQND